MAEGRAGGASLRRRRADPLHAGSSRLRGGQRDGQGGEVVREPVRGARRERHASKPHQAARGTGADGLVCAARRARELPERTGAPLDGALRGGGRREALRMAQHAGGDVPCAARRHVCRARARQEGLRSRGLRRWRVYRAGPGNRAGGEASRPEGRGASA